MSSSSFFDAALQEYCTTIFVRMCVSFSLCFFVADAWLSWGRFAASLYAWNASFKAMLSSPDHSKQQVLRHDFIRTRVARWQRVMDAVLVPLSNIASPLLICMDACCAVSWDSGLFCRVMFLSGRHVATLYWKYYKHGLSLFGATCIFKVFVLSLAVRSYYADTQAFLIYAGFRAAIRVLLALLAPDCKTTVNWNLFLSAVTCLSVWERREQLRIDGQHGLAAFVQHVIIEVVLCALVCSAGVIQEFSEKDILKASRESRAYRAVQRLLGVFCDAHLHICPRCNIIAHSPHLVHLLGPEDQAGDTRSALLGCNFLRYVGESDQQRFQDFISATAALQSEDSPLKRVAASVAEDLNSGECAMGPATSIQVSLCKDGGTHPIPVELFLTYIADFTGAPEFLMGIRETCEAPPREACTDAPGAVALQLMAASEAACGSGPDVAQVSVAQLGGRALAPTLAPLAVEQVQSPASVLAHWQLARSKALAAKAQSRKSRSSISSSSRTSSSSAGTSTQEGCVSAVCLRVDTSSRSLRVDEMLLRFDIGRQQPRLKDWLPKELPDEIMRNIQKLVNQREYGDGEEAVPCIGLGATRFARNGSTFLIAESAEVVLEPPVLVEESDCFNPFVYMNLTGVSRLRMPWQSVPQKVSRSLPTIDESLTDAACDVDALAFRSRTSGLEKTAGRESAQSTMGNRSVESTPGVVASAAISSER